MIPLLLFAMASGASGGVPVPPIPPVSITRSFYSGGRIQVDVVLGDATAFTRIYSGGTLMATLNPGVTNWRSGLFNLDPFAATHYKNGLESTQVDEVVGDQ